MNRLKHRKKQRSTKSYREIVTMTDAKTGEVISRFRVKKVKFSKKSLDYTEPQKYMHIPWKEIAEAIDYSDPVYQNIK
jgi:hypothetical protein